MKLIIVSGLSGSGKTVALHTLEDAGYFCVDNLPLGLLPKFIDSMSAPGDSVYDLIAVAVDARSGAKERDHFEAMIDQIKSKIDSVEILFLTSKVDQLLIRFSETRRKHPLSRTGLPLSDAINLERQWLTHIHAYADLIIDTTDLNVHALRYTISQRLLPDNRIRLAILVQSFGFKYGVPADTDFVFDIRCLPNPHWEEQLRHLNGRDKEVRSYLESFTEVDTMFESIQTFLTTWIPSFEKENRSYMTISIGCTGGQHRSVYLANRIVGALKSLNYNASTRHRELL